MSCTILYVESTETLMGQGSKRRLLSLLKECRDNMRGHNSFLIIITSKGSKQAFKKMRKIALKEAENWIWREFLSTSCYHKSVSSSSLEFSSSSYHPQFPTSSSSVQCPHPPCWYWTQAFKMAENNHSKRQETGSEEITAGLAVVLVAFCSGNQKGENNLRQIV